MQDPPQLDFKNNSQGSEQHASSSTKHLTIEDKEFFAVSAGLRSLEALEEYLQVVINLPQLTTDVMSKIIEFLKQFNSRTCQVVLGAGAMRSAGLKNITAKHLALASQALSIMISLIPYIRECLRRHLRAKQAVILVDFDKLRRDYQEHQYEIHAKLVAIMGDRLAVHCKTLQGIEWEKEGDSAPPNAYMETLVKEAGTLHKVLLKYLPGTALEMVMMQVLSAINSRLADEYSRIEVRSEGAKERILADAKYMRVKFSELKGLERPTPGAVRTDIVTFEYRLTVFRRNSKASSR
jgi:vacuolar protein sorting-associated protein 54